MPSDDLVRARQAMADDRPAQALRHTWKAMETALRSGDSDALTDAKGLADEVAQATTGRHHDEAVRMSRYADACLAGAGDGVAAPTLLERLFTRRTRRNKDCPDCAESIAATAKVCRFCGYRYTAD